MEETQSNPADELRQLYRKIRSRSHARTPAEFLAAVVKLLAGKANPTPGEYVAAAQRATFPCRRCAGTGQFITYVENNVPRGPGGACFRCNGKGVRNDADQRRNYGHDMHQKVY